MRASSKRAPHSNADLATLSAETLFCARDLDSLFGLRSSFALFKLALFAAEISLGSASNSKQASELLIAVCICESHPLFLQLRRFSLSERQKWKTCVAALSATQTKTSRQLFHACSARLCGYCLFAKKRRAICAVCFVAKQLNQRLE